MNTITRYKMAYIDRLLTSQQRADGVKAWHLVRETVEPSTEHVVDYEPVAVFHMDSEGLTFQRHLMQCPSLGIVDIDPGVRELFELQARNRARQAEALNRTE